MLLREIAHSRTGDKGNLLMISLIAYRDADYPVLEKSVTAERVSSLFSDFTDRPAVRFCVPKLAALNFVLHRPPGQDVTRSLALDAHGKCLGQALLNLEI